jgi:hypothetical protein
MKSFYSAATALLMGVFASAQVSAADAKVIQVNDELIKTVHIEQIEDQFQTLFAFSPYDWESDCTKLTRRGPRPNLDIDPNDIINIGKQVWEIIKNNGPVLEARTMNAHALPRGVECWDEMAEWQMPRSELYQVTYKNAYNMDVVKFRFRLLYTYGGSYNGVGRYLTNATIQYANVEVLWGFIFNASVEVPQVVNMGPVTAPMAGMQLTLNWSINTRPITLKRSVNSASFFVTGDGRRTQLQ